MAEFSSDLEQLDTQLEALEDNIAATTAITASFQNELRGMQSSISLAEKEARGFSRSLSRGLRSAFGDVIFEGSRLSDVLKNVAQSMIQSTFNQAISPVTDAISGVIGSIFGGLIPNAQGNAFVGGRVAPFAKGGVVSGPMTFPIRGGTGLMGETGPEAILPLSRRADGALGVRAIAGGQVTVNMNISTQDAESFRRSKTQIAAGISRAIQRGNRNQ